MRRRGPRPSVEPFDIGEFEEGPPFGGSGALGICSYCDQPAVWMRCVLSSKSYWYEEDWTRMFAYCDHHARRYPKHIPAGATDPRAVAS